MERILKFLLYRRNILVFFTLLFLGGFMTVQSSAYHQSRYFNSANYVSGKLHGFSSGVGGYLALKEANDRLQSENLRLREKLLAAELDTAPGIDSSQMRYLVHDAKIIRNSFALQRNYLTIDRGTKDGVAEDMGVISPEGIVGIVENVSGNFATVQSVLNLNSKINVKVKGTEFFGSLLWSGDGPRTVSLVDVPSLAPVNEGDTIVTGGMSSIFPEGVPVGTVQSTDLEPGDSYYDIEVRLFNDMARLRHVYVIENRDQEEVVELESRERDGQ